MARYIDADALYKETEKKIKEANSYRMAVVDSEFLDLINDADEADVVPREEYEALQINLKTVRYELRSLKTRYEELHYKYQIAASDGYNKLIVELKEKHTKGGEGE